MAQGLQALMWRRGACRSNSARAFAFAACCLCANVAAAGVPCTLADLQRLSGTFKPGDALDDVIAKLEKDKAFYALVSGKRLISYPAVKAAKGAHMGPIAVSIPSMLRLPKRNTYDIVRSQTLMLNLDANLRVASKSCESNITGS